MPLLCRDLGCIPEITVVHNYWIFNLLESYYLRLGVSEHGGQNAAELEKKLSAAMERLTLLEGQLNKRPSGDDFVTPEPKLRRSAGHIDTVDSSKKSEALMAKIFVYHMFFKF